MRFWLISFPNPDDPKPQWLLSIWICSAFYTELDCLSFSDDGDPRCFWQDTPDSDEVDCLAFFNTTTTTTSAPGCCAATRPSASFKCSAGSRVTDEESCNAMENCFWISTDDPDGTTAAPGCCFVNTAAAYSTKWMEACVEFFDEQDCLPFRCHWEPTEDEFDCYVHALADHDGIGKL